MRNVNRQIRDKFRIKGPCVVPFTGFLDSTRNDLADLFCELGFKIGAEVGVMWGGYSEVLLRKNPGLKLYCIDPWTPYENGRPSQEKQDRIYRRAKKVLSRLGATLIRKTSMEALADIPDGSLDFVYIDAMHKFDYVMMDIIEWSKKVKRGGIVSGHDYSLIPGCGVVPATHAYTRGHMILEWYVTREIWPSFFWVKP